MADVFTTNYRYTLTQYNTPGWDTKVNNNFIAIDATLAQFNIGVNLQGLWVNGHVYTASQSVIDGLTGTIWLCGVNHTSIASPGTFAADRAANPTYWSNITNPAATAAVSAAAAAASATAAAASQTAAGASATAAAASAVTAAASAAAATATSNSLLGVANLPNSRPLITATNVTIAVAAGSRVDSTGTTILTLTAKSKTSAGAWVTGSGQPGMGVGLVIANNTTYYVFMIMVAGIVDVYMDTSITAANKPVGTTAFVRIGSAITNGAAQFYNYKQYGQEFWYIAAVQDSTGAAGTTAAVLYTMNRVPPIEGVSAIISGFAVDAVGAHNVYMTSTWMTDSVPSGIFTTATGIVNQNASFNVRIPVDASRQIRVRTNVATNNITVNTIGYVDPYV